MNPSSSGLSRRVMLSALSVLPVLAASARFAPAQAQVSGN